MLEVELARVRQNAGRVKGLPAGVIRGRMRKGKETG